MVGEVISRSYDGVGKLVSQPSKKRHRFFRPTFPMGVYVSQPLPTKCKNLEEVRFFWPSVATSRIRSNSTERTTGCPLNSLKSEKKEIAMTLRSGPGVSYLNGLRRALCFWSCRKIWKRPRVGPLHREWPDISFGTNGSTARSKTASSFNTPVSAPTLSSV